MKSVARLIAWGATIGFVMAAPAAAQDTSSSNVKKKDPNQVICEKEEVLGTRLATRRVCKTRAEWAEQRRVQRQAIEQTQINGGCVRQAGC